MSILKRLLSLLSNSNTSSDPTKKRSFLDHNPSYREQQNAKRQRYERERTACYVCELELSFPPQKQAGDILRCPRCRIKNVLTESGATNRPERIAIYKKYDGDLYNKKSLGLRKQLERRLDDEFEPLKQQKAAGLISEKQYKSLYGKHYRQRERLLAELESRKRAELDPLLGEEKAIRANLSREG